MALPGIKGGVNGNRYHKIIGKPLLMLCCAAVLSTWSACV
jgi:hypothetical protein